MVKNLQIRLLAGPAVPVPLPQAVVQAVSSIEVESRTSGASGFTLEFTLSRQSILQELYLFAAGAPAPLVRVVILATLNGLLSVLMDGVMVHHELKPGQKGGATTLRIMGRDLTQLMDYAEVTGMDFPAMGPEARALVILAKYAAFGIAPVVVPAFPVYVPLPSEKIPKAEGTDLAYLRQLAEAAGCVFYVDPGPAPGTSVAYWGPEIKVGVPQAALNVDMDSHTNVESVNFRYDSEKSVTPIVFIQNPFTKMPIPIPIPKVNPLQPPLGTIQPIGKNIKMLKDTANMTVPEALRAGFAEASRSADAVTATGTLDVVRYGGFLKPRKLVGVRGAGKAFDGVYYVSSVTTSLKKGECKQTFELTRNALVSTIPALPV